MSPLRHSTILAGLVVLGLALTAPAALARAHKGHIDLKDGLTLAEQFGYAPEYRQNVVTFDADNAPAIRSRGASEDDTSFVHRLEGGSWVRHDFLDAIAAAYPDFAGTIHGGGYGTDRVDFDKDGNAYSVLTIRLDEGEFRNILLYSRDGCATWGVVELPFGDDTPLIDEYDRGNVTSEHDEGRLLEGPPLVAVWRQTAPWKGQWASVNELYVIQPYWSGSTLLLKTPVLVSSQYLGQIQVAGGSSFAVTSGNMTFITYSTIVPLKTKTTPTYAATYYHSTNSVGPSKLVATSKPSNDCHCTPGICMDDAGILHIVTGSHGGVRDSRGRILKDSGAKVFQYTHSTSPLSTATWTKCIPVLSSGYRIKGTDSNGTGAQTYLSLACGPDNVLHVVSRQTRRNVDSHFWGSEYDALVHQTLLPSGVWSKPHLVVVPPQKGYSQYYQKLTIDRLGRLYVSCSYFSRRDPPATRPFRRFHHRMVLISEDSGKTWRFAETADFVEGMAATP